MLVFLSLFSLFRPLVTLWLNTDADTSTDVGFYHKGSSGMNKESKEYIKSQKLSSNSPSSP